MIALTDCDAFYVSCERVFRPDLARRAVGVLTNNDVCVIARSPELKALGVAIPHRLRQRFSVVLERIVWELRGRDCIQIDDMAAPRKKLMTSRSLGRATGSRQDLREAICQHATRGGEKLRGQGSLASAPVVFIQTNPFPGGSAAVRPEHPAAPAAADR